jgi:hypothetical protein
MAPINLAHAATELRPFRGRAETLRCEKSHGTSLSGFHGVLSEKIERHEAVAHAATLNAGGIKDGSTADDAGTGERFGLGEICRRGRVLLGKNQGQDGV